VIPMLNNICEHVKQMKNIMMVEIEDDSEDIESIISAASAAASNDEYLSKIPTTVGSGSS
jgi:hypothetical protein